jgi:hypothetical protein
VAGLFKGLRSFLTRTPPRRPAAMASASVLLDPFAPRPIPTPSAAAPVKGEAGRLSEPNVAREPLVPTEPKTAREPPVLA